jgi:hypothetical protein
MTLLLQVSGEAVVLLCRRYLVAKDWKRVGVKGGTEEIQPATFVVRWQIEREAF